jgi:putative resolvase
LREERVVLGYARFSSSTYKDGLERRKQLGGNYARERCYDEVHILSNVGSGLNENR